MHDNLGDMPAEILATKQWIHDIIIGLNFCPFAKKEFVNNSIHYHLSSNDQIKAAIKEFEQQCLQLVDDESIETSLIIYCDGFRGFDNYLQLVDRANEFIVSNGYEGIFQLATMHPEYCFADEPYDSASNYTNRSPYAMLHIIREASMERVLSTYKNPENIPENNIILAQEKGADFFIQQLQKIHQHHHPQT